MTLNELLMLVTHLEDQAVAVRRDGELIRPVDPELADEVFGMTEHAFALMASVLEQVRADIERGRQES